MHKLFVYGSLLNINSAKVVSPNLSLSMYQEIFIPNLLLSFNVVIPVKTNTWQGDAGFLNISYGSKGVLGMLINITDDELIKLKQREKYYKLVEFSVLPWGKIKSFSYDYKNIICNKKTNNPPVLKEYLFKVINGAYDFEEQFAKRIKNQLYDALDNSHLICGKYTFNDDDINKLTDSHDIQ